MTIVVLSFQVTKKCFIKWKRSKLFFFLNNIFTDIQFNLNMDYILKFFINKYVGHNQVTLN